MTREVVDKEYIECLPVLYRKHYALWRERMLANIDTISQALEGNSIEAVMEHFRLSPRDVALLVRLHYFTEDEVERFGLRRIEESVRP